MQPEQFLRGVRAIITAIEIDVKFACACKCYATAKLICMIMINCSILLTVGRSRNGSTNTTACSKSNNKDIYHFIFSLS